MKERGSHHQQEEYVSTVQDEAGRVFTRTNSYVVLATGMNRWDAARKEWVAANDRIERVNGHGVVRGAQHRAILAPNTVSRSGLIDLETPGGERIVLQPVGIAVTDDQGTSIFLAEIKASKGELVAPNMMLYRDAFDLLHGSVCIKVTLDGIESDVILSERVDRRVLEELGVDVATAKLEVWHEVLRKPKFRKKASALKRRSGRLDEDHSVEFGGMSITAGTAFKVERGARTVGDPDEVGVAKEFVQVGGVDFLIESVPFLEAEAQLQELPLVNDPEIYKESAGMAGLRPTRETGGISDSGRTRPISLAAKLNRKTRDSSRLAMATEGMPTGYVIDYPILLTTQTNFTFRGDTTYYVTNRVLLYGLTRLEGGAVIKTVPHDYAVLAQVRVMGEFDCATSPFNPAIFTARDDDTVGEPVPGSTGLIASNIWYSTFNLAFAGTGPVHVHDIQSRHGHVGVYFNAPGEHRLENVQVFRCYRAIEVINSTLHVRNGLLHLSRYAFSPSDSVTTRVHAEHMTIDTAQYFFGLGPYGTLHLTNSLVCNVGGGISNAFFGNVQTVNASAFKIAGRGRHYLADSSAYRNAGTPNVSPAMAKILRGTTTFAPIVLQTNFTADATLTQVAGRDVDVPDLGYHYHPLDYCAGGVGITGATLTLAEGVRIGAFSTNAFILNTGGKLVSRGSPYARNAIIPFNAVQSETVNWNGRLESMFRVNGAGAGGVDLRYTDVSMMANLPEKRLLLGGFADTSNNLEHLSLSDSHFVNVAQTFRLLSPQTISLRNNIIERCSVNFEQGIFRRTTNAPLTLTLENNLFHRGALSLVARAGNTPWIVRDNFFDSESLIASGFNANFAPNYNALRIGLPIFGGANTRTGIEGAFQSGPLGDFYFANEGVITTLVNAGSRSAAEAGMFHHTTQAEALSREGATMLDIGFHYAVADSAGNPPDTDGDSIRDRDEDVNGNGTRDPGETSYVDRDTDLDGDGDTDEISRGTDPGDGRSLEWRSLAAWRFDGGSFVGFGGQTPLVASNLVLSPGYDGTALNHSATSGPGLLQYRGIEGDGKANISLARGSIRLRLRTFWFSNDPGLDLPGSQFTYRGLGPQEWVTLIETANLAVRVDPDGRNVFLLSRSQPGPWMTNIQGAIVIPSEDARTNISAPGFSFWTDVLVAYSPEETRLVWGAPDAPFVGSGIPAWTGNSSANEVLTVGSSPNGTGKINALIDDLVTYNVPGILYTNPWTFSAVALENPPRLKLVWSSQTNLLVDIKRRPLGSTNWQYIQSAIGTNMVDAVTPGARYEYNLNSGFLHESGVAEPYGNTMTASALGAVIEGREKVILLVDQTLLPAIEPDVSAFVTNLVGDGWTVLRGNMPRHVDDYSSALAFATNRFNITNRIAPFIRSNYTAFSNQIRHILIVGHVTIPYTGDQADDGHWSPSSPGGSHQGPWASDLYYTDVDGLWRDLKVAGVSAFLENRNAPADGKLDEDYLPTNSAGVAAAEMTVARIDFARLPIFAESETTLLKRYLEKNSRYRHRQLNFEPNAIGADLFFDFRSVRYPARIAFETASKLAVLNPAVPNDVFATPGSYVLGTQSGSGYVDRINDSRPQQQTTEDFATNRTAPNCAFYLLRSSFMADWNLENNFMRALLTPTNGGLAAGWFMTMGVWKLDPLGAGLELGHGWRESINTRLKPFWGGQSARSAQILGDSTLRYPVLAPPTALTSTRTNGSVTLNWTASAEPNCTYHVYRSNSGINFQFYRLNAAPLTQTTYTDFPPPRATPLYMVRALKVVSTGSGSFTNISQGVFRAP